MSKVSARCVPRTLIDDQKRTWLNISKYLLSQIEDYPGNFIEPVVSIDVTRAHRFDTESKKAEQTMEAPWLDPLLRNLRGFIQQVR